ncbi:MAG: zf-HC2 domain-containing protein [Planctomycetes bacterium]|nr:zf-HC2 domain-containing protein [Planctomycetota bacterium]
MNCQNIRSWLSRYLDGEVSVAEREDIERHLDGCNACQEALGQLRSVSATLDVLPAPPDVPEGLAERIIGQATEITQEPAPILLFRDLLTPPMRFAAAAVLVLGLGLGIVLSLDLNRALGSGQSRTVADASAVYGLDVLSDTPGGSLADAYLGLASGANGGG